MVVLTVFAWMTILNTFRQLYHNFDYDYDLWFIMFKLNQAHTKNGLSKIKKHCTHLMIMDYSWNCLRLDPIQNLEHNLGIGRAVWSHWWWRKYPQLPNQLYSRAKLWISRVIYDSCRSKCSLRVRSLVPK